VRSTLVLCAIAISAACPSSALGSVVFVNAEFSRAVYAAAGGEANDLRVSETMGTVTFVDPEAVIVAEPPCVQVTDHEATCAGVDQAVALLADLNDSASVRSHDLAYVGLVGDEGDDHITIYSASVLSQDLASLSLEGGYGDDRLTFCSACRGQLLGDDGSDTLTGGARHDSIFGEEGSDLIVGRAGNDFIIGGPGSDSLYGNKGNDFIGGGPGRDSIYGKRGNDHLRGKDAFFRDLVWGGRGLDTARVDHYDVVRVVERVLF
jgi:Ca2+-binding RTX toxin-like protein